MDFFLDYLAMEKRCEICGRQLISEKGSCLSCREKSLPANEACDSGLIRPRALFPYTGMFKTILASYKFGKSLALGKFFTRCLLDESLRITAFKGASWVPVPPKPGKIKRQGWDQIEFLAALLEKSNKNSKDKIAEGKLPVCRCLKRLPSRSQKELNREERRGNLKDRIVCSIKAPRIALIFDDVITTGATLNSCAEALLENGAEKVYGLCLFYD